MTTATLSRPRKLATPDTFSMRTDKELKRKMMYVAAQEYSDLATVTNQYWQERVKQWEAVNGPIPLPPTSPDPLGA